MRRGFVGVAFFLLSTFIVFQQAAVAGSDDDSMLIEYPDGSYGVDLGGGYQTLSGGSQGTGEELMLPPGYREDYKNTNFGAMTQKGFVIFPEFSFTPAADKRKNIEEEKERTKGEYVFHEASTTYYSPFSGVSRPKKRSEKPQGDLSQ